MPTIQFGPVPITYEGDVLEPRPWTLAQAEWAAELPAGPMLELGSGAGQIGLAAAALTGCTVVQVDSSDEAHAAAAANAAAAGLDGVVTQRCGDPADVLGHDERFAVVIADPPYVPSDAVDDFPDDPRTAIDGGDDGIDVVQHFVAVAADHLAAGGSIVLQLGGAAQVDAVAAWLDGSGAPPLAVRDRRTFGPDRALALLVERREASTGA